MGVFALPIRIPDAGGWRRRRRRWWTGLRSATLQLYHASSHSTSLLLLTMISWSPVSHPGLVSCSQLVQIISVISSLPCQMCNWPLFLAHILLRCPPRLCHRSVLIVSINHALILPSPPNPILWVALPPSFPSTHHSHHPSPLHSFTPGLNFPFLQIFPTIAYLFFSWTDSTDSPDYLSILLNISVFTL